MRVCLDFGDIRIWPLPDTPLHAHLVGLGTPLTVRQAMRDLARIAETVEALRELICAKWLV